MTHLRLSIIVRVASELLLHYPARKNINTYNLQGSVESITNLKHAHSARSYWIQHPCSSAALAYMSIKLAALCSLCITLSTSCCVALSLQRSDLQTSHAEISLLKGS